MLTKQNCVECAICESRLLQAQNLNRASQNSGALNNHARGRADSKSTISVRIARAGRVRLLSFLHKGDVKKGDDNVQLLTLHSPGRGMLRSRFVSRSCVLRCVCGGSICWDVALGMLLVLSCTSTKVLTRRMRFRVSRL